MRNALQTRLLLWAETAQDLMVANPISIHANAVVQEAIAFLIDKGFSAAPVIDEAGKPIGVLSRTDILVHDRTRTGSHIPDFYARADLSGDRVPKGFQVENVDRTRVRDLMTPMVLSVSPQRGHRSRACSVMSGVLHDGRSTGGSPRPRRPPGTRPSGRRPRYRRAASTRTWCP